MAKAPTQPTLEAYLKTCFAAMKRGTDHAVRCHVTEDGRVGIYIHPAAESGQTLDFRVEGNTLHPAKQTFLNP